MFKLGIAGAGVYDWRLYDTIYTERYMDTPQANPEGYKSTSVVEAAKNLSGHLVLVHGTMDDNVHFQNTVRLAYELQKADKQFDVMIYPKMRHGLGADAELAPAPAHLAAHADATRGAREADLSRTASEGQSAGRAVFLPRRAAENRGETVQPLRVPPRVSA